LTKQQFYSVSIDRFLYNVEVDELSIVKMAHTIVLSADRVQASVIILSALWEAVDFNKWAPNLQKLIFLIKQKNPTIKIELILNSWYQEFTEKLQIDTISGVTFIDFFLLLVYHRIFNLKESKSCDKWSESPECFLFLTGKVLKPNRIRLLYKFYKKELLTRAVWSLFSTDNTTHLCKSLLPELTNQEVQEFIKHHQQNPDGINSTNRSVDGFHYTGIPFDTELYQNSKFQVVSETNFTNTNLSPWITEKTWLAIINYRPFIMAGESGSLKKLQNMGFNTFDQYLINSNYDDILDDESRLESIVENTQYWLDNIQLHKKEIQVDINKNFYRASSLVKENQIKLQNVINKYNLNGSIENLITFADIQQHAQWKNWYNRIRDPSWPDCNSEQDFWTLPERIRTECIEVFGYNPKEKI
jgi:hypothetical protein